MIRNRCKLILTLIFFNLWLLFVTSPLYGESDDFLTNEVNFSNTSSINNGEELSDIQLHIRDMEKFKKNGTLKNLLEAAKRSTWVDKLDDAVLLAKTYIELNGDLPAARLIIAESLLWNGKPLASIKHFKKYFELGGKNSSRILKEYGDALLSIPDYKNASYIYFKALNYPFSGTKKEIKKLKSGIESGISTCYLENGNIEKSELWLGYARNSGLPYEQYLEERGDILVKKSSNDISNKFENGKWSSIKNHKFLEKALWDYKKSYNIDRNNKWLLVKIGDTLWELGRVNEAIKYLKSATKKLNSSYPPFQLSNYIVTLYKNNPKKLKYALSLLTISQKRGMELSAIFYKKYIIYKLLKNNTKASWAFNNSYKYATGKSDISQLIGEQLIKQRRYKRAYKLAKKMVKYRDNLYSGLLLMAKLYPFIKTPYILKFTKTHISKIKNSDEKYDIISLWKKNGREDIISKTEFKRLNNRANKEDKLLSLEKISYITNNIDMVSGSDKEAWLMEKAKLLSSIDKNIAAGDILKQLSSNYNEKSPKYNSLLFKAFQYYSWGGEEFESNSIAEELFLNGVTKEVVLSNIVLNNWWDGNKSFARKALGNMKKYYPDNSVTLQFSAREDSEKWRYKSAISKIKKIEKLYNKLNSSDKILLQEIEENRKVTLKSNYFFNDDTTDLTGNIISNKVDIPMEGYKLIPAFIHGRLTKEKMLSGKKTITTKFNSSGLGIEFPIYNGTILTTIYKSNINNEINPDIQKTLYSMLINQKSGNINYNISFSKKLLLDTPLPDELGMYKRDYQFEFYSYIRKMIYSGSYKLSILSDKNRRKTTNFSIGYKPDSSPLILKLSSSYDNMDRNFDMKKVDLKNIDNTILQSWEVYYAPVKVKNYGYSIEYSGKLSMFNYNISVGRSVERRPFINKGFNSFISLNLSIPTFLGDLVYNFYGMKSDVDPLSNQLTKEKYIGRESTFKLNYKF